MNAGRGDLRLHGSVTSFAKVQTSILDSSLAEDWQVRHVFEDMLKLCDADGVLDVTPEAFSRRTNIPIEIVTRAITALEKSDPRSRTPDYEGVRIAKIDDHRDWGWYIVNHAKFRGRDADEERKLSQRQRVTKWRERNSTKPTSPRNAHVTDVTDVTLHVTLPPVSASASASASEEEGYGEKPNRDIAPIPEEFRDSETSKAWADFQEHRRQIKKKLTPLAAEKILKRLSQWQKEKWIQAVEESIEHGWIGVFEPKVVKQKGPRPCF